MKGLKCTTTNCEYNNSYHCSAGVINVSKKSVCTTRIKRENGALEQIFSNTQSGMEAGQDFDYSKNEDVIIQCDSTLCVYNSDHICASGVVTVGNGFISPKCFTKKVKKD